MIIAFIAHPIGNDLQGNIEKIKAIGREINLNEPNVIPFAPYFFDLHNLFDGTDHERQIGMENNAIYFERKIVDELRLYGSFISKGMRAEIKLAEKYDILIKNYIK